MGTESVPLYTVGDGTRTQMAQRGDGMWFKRTKDMHGLWRKWESCGKVDPFPFYKYLVRGRHALLPDDKI